MIHADSDLLARKPSLTIPVAWKYTKKLFGFVSLEREGLRLPGEKAASQPRPSEPWLPVGGPAVAGRPFKAPGGGRLVAWAMVVLLKECSNED
jgi:hypothetical protein